jgi:hypothetical protein
MFAAATSIAVTLGEEDNDGMLFRPFQAEEGPDGNIYVFDAKDAYIKVFSPKGAYLRRMGGRGQGPGEMLRLGGFGFTPDKRLFFTEMINGHRWITFMTLDGTFDKVLKLSLQGSCGVQKAVVLPDGHILAEIHTWGIPRKTKKYYTFPYPIKLAVINPKGAVHRIVVQRALPFSISKNPSGGDTRLPFFPEFLWTVTNGGAILFSEGNNPSIQRFELDGTLPSTVATKLPDAPRVTDNDIDAWKQETKDNMTKRFGAAAYQRYASVIEDYDTSIYKAQPIFCGLDITPAGNIMIKGCRTSTGPERPFYLLNAKGEILARITTSASVIKFAEHFLIVIKPDDSDNNLVYLFSPKNKDEKHTLQMVTETSSSP